MSKGIGFEKAAALFHQILKTEDVALSSIFSDFLAQNAAAEKEPIFYKLYSIRVAGDPEVEDMDVESPIRIGYCERFQHLVVFRAPHSLNIQVSLKEILLLGSRKKSDFYYFSFVVYTSRFSPYHSVLIRCSSL